MGGELVAIAGIIAGAIVGLGGAIITAIAADRRTRMELAHAREMRDLDRIREHIDEGLLAAFGAEQAVEALAVTVGDYDDGPIGDEIRRRELRVDEASNVLDNATVLLTSRIADEPLVAAYDRWVGEIRARKDLVVSASAAGEWPEGIDIDPDPPDAMFKFLGVVYHHVGPRIVRHSNDDRGSVRRLTRRAWRRLQRANPFA